MAAVASLFGLLALAVVIGIFLVVVNEGLSVPGGNIKTSRRGLVNFIIAAIAAAYLGPAAIRELSESATRLSDVLYIPAGETTAVVGGTYEAVEWEQTGLLQWDNGRSFTLSDQT